MEEGTASALMAQGDFFEELKLSPHLQDREGGAVKSPRETARSRRNNKHRLLGTERAVVSLEGERWSVQLAHHHSFMQQVNVHGNSAVRQALF